MPARHVHRAVSHYFEYARLGLEVLSDGLVEIRFGEYLVERQAISRTDLFRALSAQDRAPGTRIGDVIATLGLLDRDEVQRLLREYQALTVVEV